MNASMVFQFASPNEVPSAGPSSRASTPSSINGYGANGINHQLQRLHNVQDRSNVPTAKRRRLEQEDSNDGFTPPPMRGGSGDLGTYVKEQQNKGNGSTAAAPFVLIDDGMFVATCFCFLFTNSF